MRAPHAFATVVAVATLYSSNAAWMSSLQLQRTVHLDTRRTTASHRSERRCDGAIHQSTILRYSLTDHTAEDTHVLILGGTGFVGSHIIKLLDKKGIQYIAASTKGNDGTTALDLTAADAANQLLDICKTKRVSTIVSAVGSIGKDCDYEVNSASGRTASAAFGSEYSDGTLPRYIFIGNSPRVRNLCNTIPSLNEYARGKEESERLLQHTFSRNNEKKYYILKPTFIYGGDDFGLNPPRLPSGIGQILEAFLGLYPIQATSEFLPDILGVTLEAPVNVEAVAGAVVNIALGLCDESNVLERREDIIMSASKRGTVQSDATDEAGRNDRRKELKRILSQRASEYTAEQNFAMLEELERLGTTHTTEGVSLSGRWDFCFDVEPDVGTGFIKELFDDKSSVMRKIVDFQGVHMEIGNEESTIQLVVSLSLFEKQMKLILHTSLSPAPASTDGGTLMLKEKFEGIELNGFRLPYPNAWRKSRYLEFSYLDEEFAIARGSGGEPHFLLRSM